MQRKRKPSEDEEFLEQVICKARDLWRGIILGEHCRSRREVSAALTALLAESAARGTTKQIGIGRVLNDSSMIITLAIAELLELDPESWDDDEWLETAKRETLDRVIAMYERRYYDWRERQ